MHRFMRYLRLLHCLGYCCSPAKRQPRIGPPGGTTPAVRISQPRRFPFRCVYNGSGNFRRLHPLSASPGSNLTRVTSRLFLGDTMYVALPHIDAVVAYAVETGKEKWRFYTAGPVRLAPVAWRDKLYFGSDDGHLYCVNASDGALQWKFRAVPSDSENPGQ